MSNEVLKEDLVRRIQTEVVDFHGAALDGHLEKGLAEGKSIVALGFVQPLAHFPAQTHIAWSYWGPSFEKELAYHDANADPNTPAPSTPPVPTAEAPETPLVPQPHSDPHAEAGPATVESGEVSGSIIDALKDAPPAE
jgi:hypothetical protein